MSSNAVGRRALKITLLVSSLFLVFFAVVLYSYEYRRKTAAVDWEIGKLVEAQTSGLVEGLWDYDNEFLEALVDGFGFYPYINYVAVEDKNGPVVSTGTRKEESEERTFTLTRKSEAGSVTDLGILRLEVDSERILSDVTAQVLLSGSFQVLFLALEAFLVVLLFSNMVTGHLAKIASYIADFGLRPDLPPLSLDKKNRGDELDVLVRAFNQMRANLDAAREAEARAAEDLRMSERVNRVLVEEAPDAILMYDYDTGRFISCNRRAELLFGRSREALLSMRPLDLFAPLQPDGRSAEESTADAVSRAFAGEAVMTRRVVRASSGAETTCEVRLAAIPEEGQRILRVSYLDITDRLRAEEKVARSLREKEVLLQEIYHRTKNNLQLIASFLNMEAMAAEDGKTVSVLNKMISRILSIALVHQKLCESEDLSRIDLGGYLEALAAEIKGSLLIERPEVAITVRAEKGIVALFDLAIPCGLAVDELLVNAANHAFPGGRGGNIRVELSRGESGFIVFTVADDGAGFPSGFDFRRDGKLGLKTVLSLVELQLYGKLSVRSGPGTTFTATIRENIHTARI